MGLFFVLLTVVLGLKLGQVLGDGLVPGKQLTHEPVAVKVRLMAHVVCEEKECLPFLLQLLTEGAVVAGSKKVQACAV